MCSILIVDDEQRVRDGLAKYLSGVGPPFHVAGVASDGLEALQMVDRLQPDVVITDINMPHMDGLTFVESLREANDEAQVIILSGYDEFAYAQRAIRAGACEYLLKPVDRGYLLALLQKLWGKVMRLRQQASPILSEALEKPIEDDDLGTRAVVRVLASWNDPTLTLDAIAAELFVNTNYLRQLFKKRTGIPFVRYIREYRLRQAQKLLLQTDLQVQQVAERVGYEDSRYFTNCFRDQFGQSPSEYKEACLRTGTPPS